MDIHSSTQFWLQKPIFNFNSVSRAFLISVISLQEVDVVTCKIGVLGSDPTELMSSTVSKFALAGALFSISGLAGIANKCAQGGSAVSITISPIPTNGGQILQQETAVISTSVAAFDPILQPSPSISTKDLAHTGTESVLSLATSSAATAVPSPVSPTTSDYNGACSERAPCTGHMTYYDTATSASNPSSCGITNDGSTELVLALPHGIMTDSDCGKRVTITYNGVTRTGTVVDKCMGCDNSSVDLSRAFFEALAGSLDAGNIVAVWYFG